MGVFFFFFFLWSKLSYVIELCSTFCFLGESRSTKSRFCDKFTARVSISSYTFSFICWTNDKALMLKHCSWRTFTLLQSNCLVFLKADSLSFKGKIAAISCDWGSFPELNASSSRNGKFCDVSFSPVLLTSWRRLSWNRSLSMTWSGWNRWNHRRTVNRATSYPESFFYSIFDSNECFSAFSLIRIHLWVTLTFSIIMFHRVNHECGHRIFQQ